MLLDDRSPKPVATSEEDNDTDIVGIAMVLVAMVFLSAMLVWVGIEFSNWMNTTVDLSNEKGKLQIYRSARDTRRLALSRGNARLGALRRDLSYWIKLKMGMLQQVDKKGKKLAATNLEREKLAKDLGLLKEKYRQKCLSFSAPLAVQGCMSPGVRWRWVRFCPSVKGKPDCRRPSWYCKSLWLMYRDKDVDEDPSKHRTGKTVRGGG